MTTLNEDILKGGNTPTEGFFNGYLIDGTTESVETKLKEAGWDGRTPKASIIVHYKAKDVCHVQLVTSGNKDIGRMMATTLWGSDQHKDSYVKFDSLDLASPLFINTMTSRWLCPSPNWSLKIKNTETGYYKVFPSTDKQGITAKGATEINIKVHTQLERGPKLTGRVGAAPINNVENIVGNGKDVFPLIQLGDQFNIEFFPQETPDTGLGLGVLPFFFHAGEEGDGASDIPDIGKIKSALSDFFNNTHLVRMKKKFTTWSTVYSMGNWEESDPKYWWPSFSSGNEGEEEQGKTHCNNQ